MAARPRRCVPYARYGYHFLRATSALIFAPDIQASWLVRLVERMVALGRSVCRASVVIYGRPIFRNPRDCPA